MSAVYRPGWQSKVYRSKPKDLRDGINRQVDQLFIKETGLDRPLHPTSPQDLENRRKWLRIRDRIIEEEFQAEVDALRHDDVLLQIPEEMRAEKWPEAAVLLETWFERPPATAPRYSAPVTHVIKMDWVLGFGRARGVYETILKERIWTNAASAKQMALHLKARPRVAGQTFGDLSKTVLEIDKEWINSRPVSSTLTWDGLAGALGGFHLQVAVAGKVVSINGAEFRVQIDEVGIYVKDSFDFNRDPDDSMEQFLGFWGYHDDPIWNSDFRLWRGRNNFGGDFLVYSDVKRIKLPQPDILTGSF